GQRLAGRARPFRVRAVQRHRPTRGVRRVLCPQPPTLGRRGAGGRGARPVRRAVMSVEVQRPTKRWAAVDLLCFAALLVDAALLAMVELFFLPLRFDGELLPRLYGWPFPITILLAAVTTPLLVR